jgi:hypothetical protein
MWTGPLTILSESEKETLLICTKSYKGNEQFPDTDKNGNLIWKRRRYSYSKGIIKKRKDIILDPNCWKLKN